MPTIAYFILRNLKGEDGTRVAEYWGDAIHLYGEHDAGPAIGGRMLRVEKADGISYYICGRRGIIRARLSGGTKVGEVRQERKKQRET